MIDQASPGSIAQGAKRGATHIATSPVAVLFERAGIATKALVYLVVGWLAALYATSKGGATTDNFGVLTTLYALPYGRAVLLVVSLGLLGYALYSLIKGVLNTDHQKHDPKGILARIGYLITTAGYGSLALAAERLAVGGDAHVTNSNAVNQHHAQSLINLPFGTEFVFAFGGIILVTAFAQLYRAYTAEFKKRLDLSALTPREQAVVVLFGRLGYASRGIVAAIIGFFLLVAAKTHNPQEAKGLSGALEELLHHAYGHVLLGIVAVGFLAYGIYSFIEATHRRIAERQA